MFTYSAFWIRIGLRANPGSDANLVIYATSKRSPLRIQAVFFTLKAKPFLLWRTVIGLL
jgi:hypothetical protein